MVKNKRYYATDNYPPTEIPSKKANPCKDKTQYKTYVNDVLYENKAACLQIFKIKFHDFHDPATI